MKRIVYFFFFIVTTSFGQNWQTNIDDAKKISGEIDKKIVLVFSGSDWCAPCIKLDKEIFSTKEFMSYATDNFVLVKADFPRRKKNALNEQQQNHNNALAEKYNPNGFFPLVVVINHNGEIQGKIGYKKTSPKEFINLLESF